VSATTSEGATLCEVNCGACITSNLCQPGLVTLWATITAHAQANGKLQIHFMDVGQGAGAVLISPQGEIVLLDDGVVGNATNPRRISEGLVPRRSTTTSRSDYKPIS